jgi:hypothetical protein
VFLNDCFVTVPLTHGNAGSCQAGNYPDFTRLAAMDLKKPHKENHPRGYQEKNRLPFNINNGILFAWNIL